MMKFTAAVLVVTLFLGTNAHACLGPPVEVQTFLNKLPKDALARDVVAKVKILSMSVDKVRHKRISKVRVIDAIKGVKKNDVFNIVSETHLCARDHDIKSGQTYFIAGLLKDSGFFEGLWRGYIQYQ